MYDDSSSSSMSVGSTNPSPTPIQTRDDRSVNSTKGESRERGKFQKLLDKEKGKVSDSEFDEELTSEGKSVIDMLAKAKTGGAGFSLDMSLDGEDKDDLLALIGKVEEKEKGIQGMGGSLDPALSSFAMEGKLSTQQMAISGVSSGDAAQVKDSAASSRLEVWALLEKVVDSITAMKSDGKVETTLTLKEPPLFQGSQIKIEEFNHARGEFNIAFENLSPQAKQLVDMESNRENLKRALEERGYLLHIVTSNIEMEKPKPVEQSPYSQDQPRQGNQQGGQGGKDQGKEKEEDVDQDF